MDHHFIESYEDEREVLRRIEELKAAGYAESDMYVLARSSEQLTKIHTRTNVAHHAAEGKGMGRFGALIRKRYVFSCIDEDEVKAQEIADLYQHLSEGELLFFCNKTGKGEPEQFPHDSNAPSSHNLLFDESEEEQISIDSQHYEILNGILLQGVMTLNKHFIETYETEDELMRQVEKLKNEGYSESDMYIIAERDGQLSMVKGRTNIDAHAEQGNWMDRFTSFLTDNNQMEMAFENMQLTEHEAETYHKEVEDGKLLLYVNKDYEARFEEVGGDSFKLGEKEKTELQNRKKQSENAAPAAAEREEKVELDDHHYSGEKDGDLHSSKKSDV
ncbi:general stress protein [Planococcus sp. MERTA32b]|nr:general stress protein [Planococcus sp. MER TA 32b]